MGNLNMKVKVSTVGGQVGRTDRGAWNAVVSLHASGVQIQMVSRFLGVSLLLARINVPLLGCRYTHNVGHVGF